jgi:hypothetical protein
LGKELFSGVGGGIWPILQDVGEERDFSGELCKVKAIKGNILGSFIVGLKRRWSAGFYCQSVIFSPHYGTN